MKIKRFPIELCGQTDRAHFRITTLCNANCVFCLGNFACDKGEHQPLAYVKKSLKKARESGLKRLVLSGGEPTVHPNFVEIVRFAKELGIETVQVVTNGIKFGDEAFAASVAQAGADDITFSIHGPNSQIHDGLVGRIGAFDSLCTGVRNLQKFPKIIISADITLSKANLGRFRETVEFVVTDLGIRRDLNLISMAPVGAALNNKDAVFPSLQDISVDLQDALSFIDENKLIAHVLVAPPQCLGEFVRYRQEADKMVEEVMVRQAQGFFDARRGECEGFGCKYCGIGLVCKKIFNQLNAFRDKKLPKAAKIRISQTCNNNCSFCTEKLDGTFFEEQAVSKKLALLRKLGAQEITFTGPEPSIHPKIIQILKKARALGFKKISMESNGRMFSSKKFALNAKNAGLDEVSISIHGHIPKIHDEYVRVQGSLKQILAGFSNAKECGLVVNSRTLLLRQNVPFLEEVAVMLKGTGLSRYFFEFANPNKGVVKKLELKCGVSVDDPFRIVAKVSDLPPYLTKAARVLAPDIAILDFPLCACKGFERFVSNQPIDFTDARHFEKGLPSPVKIAETLAFSAKYLSQPCFDCANMENCDGVFEKYAWLRGFKELSPIPGKKNGVLS